jgi:hypothetical protein
MCLKDSQAALHVLSLVNATCVQRLLLLLLLLLLVLLLPSWIRTS